MPELTRPQVLLTMLSDGDQLLVLILRQGAPATVLAPEKNALTFSYEGGTQTINVQTDAIGVKVEVTDGFMNDLHDKSCKINKK